MIKRQTIAKRFLWPVGTLFVIWLLSTVLLRGLVANPAGAGNPLLYRLLANGLSLVRIVALLGGGLLIYPPMYFRGATARERLLGVFVVPAAYMVSEMLRVTAYFSLPESIYYGFNSVVLGSFFLQLAWLGIADLACRWWVRRRSGRPQRVVGWLQPAGIVVGFGALYVLLLWEGGVHWFYVYQQGYRLLFQ